MFSFSGSLSRCFFPKQQRGRFWSIRFICVSSCSWDCTSYLLPRTLLLYIIMYRSATTHSRKPHRRNFRVRTSHGQRGHLTMVRQIQTRHFQRFVCGATLRRTHYAARSAFLASAISNNDHARMTGGNKGAWTTWPSFRVNSAVDIVSPDSFCQPRGNQSLSD